MSVTVSGFDPVTMDISIPTPTVSAGITCKDKTAVNFQHFPRTNAGNVARGFFNHEPGYQNEKQLFDLCTTELYNQHGVKMNYYITTYDTNYDTIFGEDMNRRFVRAFSVMTYFRLPREDKVWNKFGIEGLDEFSLYITKRHFQCASTYNPATGRYDYEEYIPKMGDIIMSIYNKYIYEITEIKETAALWLQSKQHVWEIIVRPFKDEHIRTSGTSVSADYIADYTDKDSDIFGISEVVDTEVSAVEYDSSNEKQSDDPWGGW